MNKRSYQIERVRILLNASRLVHIAVIRLGQVIGVICDERELFLVYNIGGQLLVLLR